jgi:membrane protein DedA with SNARE-associated domain
MSTPESIILTYGYPALLLGTVLEGEAVVIIAGVLAYQGYLDLPTVMLIAFVGTFLTDQSIFLLGRAKGLPFLERRPRWKQRAERVHQMMDRYEQTIIIGLRFLYGFRTITPFVIGMSGFNIKRFFFINALGGLLWAVVMASAGYLCSQTLARVGAGALQYQLWIMLAFVIVGTGLGIYLKKKYTLTSQ